MTFDMQTYQCINTTHVSGYSIKTKLLKCQCPCIYMSVIDKSGGQEEKSLILFSIKTHGPNYLGKLTRKSVPCPKWGGCNLHLINVFHSSVYFLSLLQFNWCVLIFLLCICFQGANCQFLHIHPFTAFYVVVYLTFGFGNASYQLLVSVFCHSVSK